MSRRMSTGIERVFRQVSPIGANPTIYQEFILHFLYTYDDQGTKISTKLDKTVPGDYYREARNNEHSLYGEYTYEFPDGITRRIVCVRVN